MVENLKMKLLIIFNRAMEFIVGTAIHEPEENS